MQNNFFITIMLQVVIFFNAGAMEPGGRQQILWKASAITETSSQPWRVKADLAYSDVVVLRTAKNLNSIMAVLYNDPASLNSLSDLLQQGQDYHYQIADDPTVSGEFGIQELRNNISSKFTEELESSEPYLIQVANKDNVVNQKVFNIVGLVSSKDQSKDEKKLHDPKPEIKKTTHPTNTTTSSYNKKPILLGVGVTFVAVLIAFLQYKGYIKIPYIS